MSLPPAAGIRLAVWSGPRNISTALMRSWAQRDDCRVVDEPLYAHYLAATRLDHPGRDEVIASGETSWEAVVADLTQPVSGIYYQKQMAHHLLPGLPRQWIELLTNILLIRDPADVVRSYVRKRLEVIDSDVGLAEQVELRAQLGPAVPVIDAADFLSQPEMYLRWLCDLIGVRFSGAMLSWPSGPSDSDGVWARHWYGEVLASTGFVPYRRIGSGVSLPRSASQLVERLRPLYEELHAARLVL
jgi:Sulfotransferase domain